MNILVTGHRGYIGSRLVPQLELLGHRISLFSGDVSMHEHWTWNTPQSIDIIIHMASMNGLRNCESNPDRSFEVNYLSTFYAGMMARKRNAKLIFTSTTTAPQYQTIYERDRWGSERVLASMRGLDYTVLHLSTVYGRSSVKAKSGRGVISHWIDVAESGKDIMVYRQVADARRNYVHIKDVVDCLLRAIDAPPDIYEVCSPESLTVLEAATEIANRNNVKVILTDPEESLYPVECRDEIIINPHWIDADKSWISFRDGIEQ